MSDFLTGSKWICGDRDIESPLFRKSFCIQADIKSATLWCTGLGYFEAYINGRRIGDDVLVPAQTDYDYRVFSNIRPNISLKTRNKVYFLEYDITKQIRKGENGIGLWIGNGFYRQTKTSTDGDYSYDFPKAIARLEIECTNGKKYSVVTNESWYFNESPIIYNNVYYGEVFDANKSIQDWCMPECDLTTWKHCYEAIAPTGSLVPQDCPTDKIQQSYLPKLVYKDYNRSVYDIGKNISGWVVLGVSGRQGQEVVLSFAEEIDDNMVLDYTSTTSRTTSQVQKITYILNDEMIQYYTPKFFWASFRYIQVETGAEIFELRAKLISTAIKQQGSFYCSNELYNDMYRMYINTQRTNIHGCVVTNNPHRDRAGQTAVAQLVSEPLLLTFDSFSLVRKWIDDLIDSQDLITGYVPNTAPFVGGSGGVGWGSAIVVLPFMYYQETGDLSILRKALRPMRMYVEYLDGLTRRDYIIHDIDKDLGAGEFNTPEKVEISREFVNTCIYAYLSRLMVYVSDELDEDSSEYVVKCNNIVKTITKKWYNVNKKSFHNGLQGANAYALWVNAVPRKDIGAVAQNLADYITNECDGNLDTGAFGTPILLDMLTKYGHSEVAYSLMNKKSFPSYGYMIRKGSSTLWERFDGKGSHNSMVLGSYVTWFMRSIVGINLDYMSPGYDNIVINPSLVAYFEYAYGKLITHQNELISVSWHKHRDEIIFDIILPELSSYQFFCPKGYDVITTKKLSATNHSIVIKISSTI